jgi:hypothetical protein
MPNNGLGHLCSRKPPWSFHLVGSVGIFVSPKLHHEPDEMFVMINGATHNLWCAAALAESRQICAARGMAGQGTFADHFWFVG